MNRKMVRVNTSGPFAVIGVLMCGRGPRYPSNAGNAEFNGQAPCGRNPPELGVFRSAVISVLR